MSDSSALLRRTCGIAVLSITVASGCSNDSAHHNGPTQSITYRVQGHGHADITYRADDSATHPAQTAVGVRLPWTTTVDLPVAGSTAHLSVVLGEEGGQAACSIAVSDKEVQRAVASGSFGRATCRLPRSAAGQMPTARRG